MHYITACFFLLFALYAKGIVDPLVDYSRYKGKCSKKLGFKTDTFDVALQNYANESTDFFVEFGKTNDAKCFLKCLAEEAGHFKDGFLDVEYMKKYIPSGVTINQGKCTSIKFVDQCDYVYNISKCIHGELYPE